MAIILRRLLTFGVALAFLVGTTAQRVPCGMAYAETSMGADMAADAAQTKAPGSDRRPTCVDRLGCVGAPALPASPPSVGVTLQWISPDYDLATAPLSGISLKPDLSPPIPAA